MRRRRVIQSVALLASTALSCSRVARESTAQVPIVQIAPPSPASSSAHEASLPVRPQRSPTPRERADSTGIAACDDFLDRYERCVRVLLADADGTTAPAIESIRQMRTILRDAAERSDDEGSHRDLARSCRNSADVVRDSMVKQGCDW